MNWQESPVFHFAGLRDYFGYIPVSDVISMPRENREKIALLEVVFGNGISWKTGIVQGDSLKYDAPTSTGLHGSSYAHRITGFYPSTSPADERMISAMLGKRYLVIFQDRNNRWRLLGNKNTMGARFFCSMKIETFEGVAGYAFEFVLQSRYPAPQLLFHPAENAQVYAAANGYNFLNLEQAYLLVNSLQSLPA